MATRYIPPAGGAGGGGGMAIGGAVTSGTSGSILYVDGSSNLAQDNTNFRYDSAMMELLVPKIGGGTATSANLVLEANQNAFAYANTGRIQIMERITFSESFTPAGLVNDAIITVGGTVTSAQIINILQGFRYTMQFNVSVGQVLSSSPAFQAAPRFTHTAVGLSDTLTYYMGFDSRPGFDTTAASGTSTSGFMYGYNANPVVLKTGAAAVVVPAMYGFTTFSTPLIGVTDWVSGITVTDYASFRSYPPVASGATATTWTGFKYENVASAASNAPTVTNEYAFTSNLDTSSTKYNLRFTGTALSFMRGGLRIGDASPAQPTEKLEVLGNIYLDNGGTASELRLREPSGGGSSYAGFKAAALSANAIYSLPDFPGSTQLMQCSSAGVISFTSAGSGNAVIDSAYRTSDLGRTSAVTSADPEVVCSFPGTGVYAVEGWFHFTADSATPDLKIAFDVATSTFNAMTMSYVAYDAASGTAFDNQALIGDNVDSSTIAVTTTPGIFIYAKGYVNVTNAGTLAFKWSRSAASGTTTIKTGSWMRITQM